MSRPRPPAGGPPLPMRDGVSPSCMALPPGDWATILDCLTERLSRVSAEEWLQRMQAGEVVDEHGVAVCPTRAHRAGLRVYYYRSLPHEATIPFEDKVVFQDELLVVADKPHFLPVTPGGRYVQETLLVRLKRKLGIATLSPIHRIDRETAGLVVFCVKPETRGAYQNLFVHKAVTKRYEAIAPYREQLKLPLVYRSRLLDHPTNLMQMQEVAGEANSETHIALLERRGDFARYQLSPVTGRRHQLRVHCAALGIPIVHDLIYPALQPEGSDDHARPLQLLAARIRFTDPVTGQSRQFNSSFELMDLRSFSTPHTA